MNIDPDVEARLDEIKAEIRSWSLGIEARVDANALAITRLQSATPTPPPGPELPGIPKPGATIPTRFVAPDGNDDAPGTEDAPWKSIARCNVHRMQAGEVIGFQRGGTYAGNLRLSASGSETAKTGYCAWGNGGDDPIIVAGSGNGVTFEKESHWFIEDIVVQGFGAANSSGILVVNESEPAPATMTMVDGRVSRCKVRDFDFYGIGIRSFNTLDVAAIDGVIIEYCEVSGCGLDGIGAQGNNFPMNSDPAFAITNLHVRHSKCHGNDGRYGGLNFAGNGIRLTGVRHSTIEYCEAWDNGGANLAAGGGPVGIWFSASRDVAMRHNHSHHNKSAGGDGGGFDFDGMMIDAVCEYNLSHDNHGAGYFHAHFAYANTANQQSRNIVFRYNYSINDVEDYKQGALTFSVSGRLIGGERADASTLTRNLQVYNNTFVMRPSGPAVAIWNNSAAVVSGFIRNNLFYTRGVMPVWYVGDGPRGTYYPTGGVEVDHNLYWQTGAPGDHFKAGYKNWGSVFFIFDVTGTLADWGVDIAPVVADPGFSDGRGVDPSTSYRLSAGSPAVSAGVVIPGNGGRDYYGNELPAGRPDIGAHQLVAA